MRRLILFLMLAFALPARAQFQGFSAPLTVASTPFNNVACTGSQQTADISNFAQTQHFITITTAGGVLGFKASIQGSHDGTTYNDISDVATQSANSVMGQGYYPTFRAVMTCATAAGTFTIKYSGQATAPAPQIGAMASGQVDKTLASAVAANANFTTPSIRTPFGTSGGAIYFTYSGTGPSGSTLNVACTTLAISTAFSVSSFPLVTSTAVQQVLIPVVPCDFFVVAYTSGGASAVTFTMSYVFNTGGITGGDPCQGSTVPKSSVAIAVTATAQLVAPLSGHLIYVCGYNLTLGGTNAPTAQFTTGTGATCGTGTVNQTGTMGAATITSGGGGYQVFRGNSGQGLCLVVAGTTPTAQGVVSFIQQ